MESEREREVERLTVLQAQDIDKYNKISNTVKGAGRTHIEKDITKTVNTSLEANTSQ